MNIDETLKNNLIADVENILYGVTLSESCKTELRRCFEITIGTYLLSCDQPEEITDEEIKEALHEYYKTKLNTDEECKAFTISVLKFAKFVREWYKNKSNGTR